MRAPHPLLSTLALGLVLSGCATRGVDVAPSPADPAQFVHWTCEAMVDEQGRVQQRAAEVAWAADQRAGHNVQALGLGLAVFWPAVLALQREGPQANELAFLKGRFDGLQAAAAAAGCAPAGPDLSPARRTTMPVAAGERLVYEDRRDARQPATEWGLSVTSARRAGNEYRVDGPAPMPWRQDVSGNVLLAPPGALEWPQLLRSELALGQVVSGEIVVAGDPQTRARMRGQVVAVGPHRVLQRRFDAAVVELFGDAQLGEAFTRVEGAIVVDRVGGVLLRLDLQSANPAFRLQRQLLRVESARD